jgi:alanine dehydrogenase
VVLLLTEADTRECLDVSEAIDAIEQAYGERARGRVVEGRADLALSNGWLRMLPCVLEESGVLGFKEIHLIRQPGEGSQRAAVRYSINLFDGETGSLLAILDGSYLTGIRTAATAALAARYLAPQGASRVGVIGSGFEARTQLAAVAHVLPLRSGFVYSRDPERRTEFAREMGETLGIEVQPAETPQAAVEPAQILIVATNTAGRGAALLGEWLHTGLHVSSIGSTTPTQREVDPEVWRRADHIVIDSSAVLENSGDAIVAGEEGAIDTRKVVVLDDLVSGARAGRERDEDLTLYKSTGTSLQDIAVAHRALLVAHSRNIGQEVPDFLSAKMVEPN